MTDQIVVKEDDHKFRESHACGGASVADLELYISREADRQRQAWIEQQMSSGVQYVEHTMASPRHWLEKVAKMFENRVEYEIKDTDQGVLFRITAVKPYARRNTGEH